MSTLQAAIKGDTSLHVLHLSNAGTRVQVSRMIRTLQDPDIRCAMHFVWHLAVYS
jgi:hypothetical protein